jgi:hypothetical protein
MEIIVKEQIIITMVQRLTSLDPWTLNRIVDTQRVFRKREKIVRRIDTVV